MTQKEYEQKKRECWEEFIGTDGFPTETMQKAFYFAFDRAYALGKQTETISQEEIENEAVDYAFGENKKRPDARPDTMPEYTCEDLIDAFKAGANFALGKQEIKQETKQETVISGWVARDEDADCPGLYTFKPLRQKKGFKDGYWSYGLQIGLSLDPELFPDLSWESDPIEVELIIKRKKNGKQ